MQNSLDKLKMAFNSPAGLQSIQNKSYAAFGQVNWHVVERFHRDRWCARHARRPAYHLGHLS